MEDSPTKCVTPDCPNMTDALLCTPCLALEASQRSPQAVQETCAHGHSVIGDFDMIIRLLPEYKGGHSQPGYMLDVCKACLMELQERPYNPMRAYRQAPVRGAAVQQSAPVIVGT
jgi:hypothetical protein